MTLIPPVVDEEREELKRVLKERLYANPRFATASPEKQAAAARHLAQTIRGLRVEERRYDDDTPGAPPAYRALRDATVQEKIRWLRTGKVQEEQAPAEEAKPAVAAPEQARPIAEPWTYGMPPKGEALSARLTTDEDVAQVAYRDEGGVFGQFAAGTGEVAGRAITQVGRRIERPFSLGLPGLYNLIAEQFGQPAPLDLETFPEAGKDIIAAGKAVTEYSQQAVPAPKSPDSLLGYLTDPGNTANIIARSLPYTAGVMGATAAGGPVAGYVFAYGQEWENIHASTSERLRDKYPQMSADEVERLASATADLGAPVSALIEYASAKALLDLASPQKKALVDAVIKKILAKTPDWLIKASTSGGAKVAFGSMIEGVQEVFQGTDEELAQLGVAGLPIEAGFWRRRADELIIGGLTGALIEGPAQVAAGQSMTDVDATLAKLNETMRQMGADAQARTETPPWLAEEARAEAPIKPVDAEEEAVAPEAGAAAQPEAPAAEQEGKQAWEMTGEEFESGGQYGVAGEVVDGRSVLEDVPNMSSIEASVEGIELSGIREVPMSAFTLDEAPPSTDKRTIQLAEEIRQSTKIAPLIVVVDSRGPYILEGGHRYDALKLIGAKSFPAVVVIEADAHYVSVENALKDGLPVPASVLAKYPDLAAKYGGQAGAPAADTKARIAELHKKLHATEDIDEQGLLVQQIVRLRKGQAEAPAQAPAVEPEAEAPAVEPAVPAVKAQVPSAAGGNVDLKINFPMSKAAAAGMKRVSSDPFIIRVLSAIGIRGVTVDPPYSFDFSQQGGVTRDGYVRINPNAENVERTFGHELGHIVWEMSSPEERAKLEQAVRSVKHIIRRAASGYTDMFDTGKPEEAISELYAQYSSLPASIQNMLVFSPTGKTFEQAFPKAPPTREQAAAPKERTRMSWDAVVKANGGYITDAHDIQWMIDNHGDSPVVIKDVNGGRHVMPASMALKLLANPLVSGHVNEIFVPAKAEQFKDTVRFDNQILWSLPNMALGIGQTFPEIAGEHAPIRNALERGEAIRQALEERKEAEAPAVEPTAPEAPQGKDVTLGTTASLQQAADVEPEQEMLGAGIQLPGMRRPARQGPVPQSVQVPDTAVERAMQAASGVQRQTVLAKIKETAVSAFHKATRPQENIPRTGKFAAANEFFRLLKNIWAQVTDDSARRIATVVDPLSPQELQVFERLMLARNMVAALDRGEPLRLRFQSRQQVEAYKAQLEALLDKAPNVQKALDNQHVVRSELLQELVEYKILPKSVLDNVDTYVHQQVLSKMQADRLVGASSARRITRAAQRARVTGPESLGAEYDYNTSYIESEWTWMAELSAELEKEKMLRTLDGQYGIKSQLKAEAKAAGVKDWREMLRNHPDHAIWQPKPGNAFYRANTIPEQVAEYLLQNPEEWAGINSKDLGAVVALGQKNREFVLPENIVKELDNLSKPTPSGAVSALAQEAMRGWKVWTLFWPKRAVSYMLRNVTGDFDPVAGAAPGVVKYVPKATPELWRFARGNLSLSPDMKRARDLGVVSSGMTTVEIPDLKDLKVFSRFYDARASGNENIAAQYFKTVKGYNEFRENVLRYSSYLYYLDKLKAGTLVNYGGANKTVVDALAKDMGKEVAAAHLARNLLGDYGDRTVFGNWMRLNMMPFFSWMEINLHRYPRMFFNAAIEGKLRGGSNKAAVAALGTLATVRIAMLYATLYCLNRLFFPEDDDKLSDDDRASLHITLGHNADGSVRVFRNVGALSDFTEWFGINTMASLYPKYANGQISTGEMLKEAAKSPVNKLAFGLRPEYGAALSLAGISLYPDAFNPRRIDTAEGLVSTFGLRDEYIEAAGRIGGTGKRARPHYAQRWFVGVVEPAENALSATYDLRETFLKKEGRPRPVIMGESSIKAMRQSVSRGDYDTFVEARKAYLKSGKTYRNWRAALSAIDPIGNSLNAEDEKKFIAWLSEDQRSKVDIARDYARGLEVEMWKWWQRAAETDEPAAKYQMEVATDAEISARAAKLYAPSGEMKEVSPILTYTKRKARRAEQEEARQWLHARGIGRFRAVAAMRQTALRK